MSARTLTPDQAASLLGDLGFVNALLERDTAALAQVRQYFPRPSDLDAALREVKRKRAATIQRADSGSAIRYEVVDGGFMVLSGERAECLTNFVIKIDADTVIDDGAERKHTFSLSGAGVDGTEWTDLKVTPAETSRHGWHIERLGATAVLAPLPRANDHLLAAMQTLSSPQKATAFAHTGFRDVGGQPVFLHADGGIGSAAVNTILDGQLGAYRLPDSVVDAADALSWSLKLLEVGLPTVTMPLLLAAYRAPLSEILPMDSAIHVYGKSGAQKSTLVALALNHFGSFTYSNLPASWNDTEAALEYFLFGAKDVLAVIDDWSPKSSDLHDETRRKGNKIFRAIGNRSARRRMRSDLSARPARPPRGLVISTGEDVPTEESILARMLLVPMAKGDIDKIGLTLLQDNQHRLGHAMRAYIEWLIPKLDVLKVWLPIRFRLHRARFQRAGVHLRGGAAAAHLAVAGDLIVRFASDVKVFDALQADRFLVEVEDSLVSLLSDQSSRQEESDPVRRFLTWLMDLVAQDKVGIRPTTGGANTINSSVHVGWQDANHFFLIPSGVYGEVVAAMKMAGEAMPVSTRSLSQRLHEAGVLVREERDVYTTKRTFNGKKERVIKLRKDKVAEIVGTSSSGTGTAAIVPLPTARSAGAVT